MVFVLINIDHILIVITSKQHQHSYEMYKYIKQSKFVSVSYAHIIRHKHINSDIGLLLYYFVDHNVIIVIRNLLILFVNGAPQGSQPSPKQSSNSYTTYVNTVICWNYNYITDILLLF